MRYDAEIFFASVWLCCRLFHEMLVHRAVCQRDVGDVVVQIFIAISKIAHRILYNRDRSQICDSKLSSLWRKYHDVRKMIG